MFHWTNICQWVYKNFQTSQNTSSHFFFHLKIAACPLIFFPSASLNQHCTNTADWRGQNRNAWYIQNFVVFFFTWRQRSASLDMLNSNTSVVGKITVNNLQTKSHGCCALLPCLLSILAYISICCSSCSAMDLIVHAGGTRTYGAMRKGNRDQLFDCG